MEKYINTKGKQIIGWDEILEGGLAPNATVMSWRGEEGGIEAAKQNHDVIMSPTTYVYLDYSQTKNEDSVVIGGYLPLEKVYSYDPMPEALEGTPFAKYVKGAQGNVWTEYIRTDSKLEYILFPRLAALSEAVWTQPDEKNWDRFQQKLPFFFTMLDKLGSSYSKAFYEIQTAIVPNANKDGVQWQLSTKMPDAQILFSTPVNPNPARYLIPLDIQQGGLYKAFIRKDGKDDKPVEQTFSINLATGRNLTLTTQPSKKYPGNGGTHGLVNGAISNAGLKSAEWLGWEGGDMEAVIDLGSSRPINEVKVYVLESQGSWIYRPSDLKVFVSDDNKNFSMVGAGKKEELTAAELPRLLHTKWQQQNNTPVKGRYVKVMLTNFGVIPTGMPGASHKAWLFVDEIEIN
jgi:hexosaminidase